MSTVDYYDRNAERFFRDTVDADMGALREKFTRLLRPGARILDAGCGSGRDSKAFIAEGFDVVAFDASEELVTRARSHAGIPVLKMGFEDVSWVEAFDGVWASASLLHVPRVELPSVLERMGRALSTGGVLYASFKRGSGDRLVDGRQFTDVTSEALQAILGRIDCLSTSELWESRDARPGRGDQLWVNCLARRC